MREAARRRGRLPHFHESLAGFPLNKLAYAAILGPLQFARRAVKDNLRLVRLQPRDRNTMTTRSATLRAVRMSCVTTTLVIECR
jgi:hypothetical protein